MEMSGAGNTGQASSLKGATMTSPSLRSYRIVPGFSGCLVNDYGSVIGKTGRVLTSYPDPDGYLRVKVQRSTGQWCSAPIHRLVCLAFHGVPPTSLHMACHIDGSRKNNIPSNVYWGTAQQNTDDCVRHGRRVGAHFGESNHGAKLTAADVNAIRSLRRSGETQKRVAERFGVTRSQISHIENGKVWKTV